MSKKRKIDYIFAVLILSTVCVFQVFSFDEYNTMLGKFGGILTTFLCLLYAMFVVIGEAFLWSGIKRVIVFPANAFNIISGTVLILLAVAEIICSLYCCAVDYGRKSGKALMVLILCLVFFQIIISFYSLVLTIKNKRKEQIVRTKKEKRPLNIIFAVAIFLTVGLYQVGLFVKYGRLINILEPFMISVAAVGYSCFTVMGEMFLWSGIRQLSLYRKTHVDITLSATLALLSVAEIICSIYFFVKGFELKEGFVILAMIAVIIAYSIVVAIIRRIINRKKQNRALAIPEEQNT